MATLLIQSTTSLVLLLQALTRTGHTDIDEVYDFPCQNNMAVMPKIAAAFLPL